jgi:2-C-methyl-D-erythritol 4-phosphate cytidylyltransferase
METPRGHVAVVVPCAGLGKRMGHDVPKQFMEIGGKPILVHTLQKFDSIDDVAHIILVVPQDHLNFTKNIIAEWEIQKVSQVIAGGKERQDSVKNGLKAVRDACNIILIHDGVRPLVSVEKIREVIQKTRETGAAILAAPVKDTIKRGQNRIVDETLDRNSLWAVQTPQGFRTDLIHEAYRRAWEDDFYGTDDAMLVERMSRQVRVVHGSRTNIKITTQEDLALAEALSRTSQKLL